MKEIKLTKGKIAIIDDDDFEKVKKYKWCVDKAGGGKSYYAKHTFVKNKKRISLYLHRIISNAEQGKMVYHKNGDTLDCRKENLIVCTRSERWTVREKRKGASKFYGVSKDNINRKDKWRVNLKRNNKKYFIGTYEDDITAALAHDYATIEIDRDFARLNFSHSFLKKVEKEFYELNPDTKRRIEEAAKHKVGDNNLLMLLMLYLQKIIESFVSKKSVDIDEENV